MKLSKVNDLIDSLNFQLYSLKDENICNIKITLTRQNLYNSTFDVFLDLFLHYFQQNEPEL